MFALAPLFAPPQLWLTPKTAVIAGTGFDPAEMMAEAGLQPAAEKPSDPVEKALAA